MSKSEYIFIIGATRLFARWSLGSLPASGQFGKEWAAAPSNFLLAQLT
jgi:hypothetical protein